MLQFCDLTLQYSVDLKIVKPMTTVRIRGKTIKILELCFSCVCCTLYVLVLYYSKLVIAGKLKNLQKHILQKQIIKVFVVQVYFQKKVCGWITFFNLILDPRKTYIFTNIVRFNSNCLDKVSKKGRILSSTLQKEKQTRKMENCRNGFWSELYYNK